MQKLLTGKRRITGLAFLLITTFVCVWFFTTKNPEGKTYEPEFFNEAAAIPVAQAESPMFLFGIPVGLYEVENGTIKRNQTFADLLLPYGVSSQELYEMERLARNVHSVRRLNTNKNYSIFYRDDSLKRAGFFVYEASPKDYVVYQFEDSLSVYRESRNVEVIEKTMSGKITESLDQSIRDEGGSAALVNAVADLFGWQIDMRTLYKGDWFRIVYEELTVNGEPIGIGNILGAEFNYHKNTYKAFGFDQGEGLNYFDENGVSIQKAFLRYPVEYSRISSRYNPRRYHPVLKRRTPHLGTDYAANRGTPIKAAGDGIIVARGYTGGNGNYVKIKHNGTYTTGYLHMSRFGKFKQGQKVKKGDIIGYVGKTGLATGYHLCFRFWKRGTQVDFLKEELPAELSLKAEYQPDFNAMVQTIEDKLFAIEMPWIQSNITVNAR